MDLLTGYLATDYAQSLAEFGEILILPKSGLPLLKREIDGTAFDLRGLYPYAVANCWEKIALDIDYLNGSGALSIVLVTDPFVETQNNWATLAEWDVCKPFKTHQMVDLTADWRSGRSNQTKRLTRRALQGHQIETDSGQRAYASQLWQMYQRTINRFGLTGIRRMSETAIAKQLAIPGAFLITAQDELGLAGAMMCIDQASTSNGHLLFLSARAAENGTSYALYHGALEAAENRGCTMFNFGSASGSVDNPNDGLFRFKGRWSNCQARSYLCGMVLDTTRYAQFSSANTSAATISYFPAYRSP